MEGETFAKGTSSYTTNLPTIDFCFDSGVLHHIGKAAVEHFGCVERAIGDNGYAYGRTIMQFVIVSLRHRDVEPDPESFDQVFQDLPLVLEREAAFDAEAQFHPAHNHPLEL